MIEPGNYIAGTNIFTKASVEKLADEIWNKMPHNIREDYGKKWFDSRVSDVIMKWFDSRISYVIMK